MIRGATRTEDRMYEEETMPGCMALVGLALMVVIVVCLIALAVSRVPQ